MISTKQPKAGGKSNAVAMVLLALLAGCNFSDVLGSRHQLGWRSSRYFSDGKVIALCEAISTGDAIQTKSLITPQTASHIGRGGMSPLLWAMMDRKLDAVEVLLQAGADPNHFLEEDFNARKQGVFKGVAPIHIAAGFEDVEYLRLLLENGADANLVDRTTMKETPIYKAISRPKDIKGQLSLLLQHGTDINHRGSYTPVMHAINLGRYDLVLMLLEKGADPRLPMANGSTNLIHLMLVAEGETYGPRSEAARRDYNAVLTWLSIKFPLELEQAREKLLRLWGGRRAIAEIPPAGPR